MEIWRTGISYIQRKRRTASWFGHVVHRNCLLKRVIEEKNTKKDRSEGKTKKIT
jgi:hypothetical protein